jgi:hypothetical protein
VLLSGLPVHVCGSQGGPDGSTIAGSSSTRGLSLLIIMGSRCTLQMVCCDCDSTVLYSVWVCLINPRAAHVCLSVSIGIRTLALCYNSLVEYTIGELTASMGSHES